MGLMRAKTLYQLSMRMPARAHGVDKKLTTARLLDLAEDNAKQYSQALQACLEGERPVAAAELNEPLMVWNAIWRVLNKRLPPGLGWDLRRDLLNRNMQLLSNPCPELLWDLTSRWMNAREAQEKALRELDQPAVMHLRWRGSSEWVRRRPD